MVSSFFLWGKADIQHLTGAGQGGLPRELPSELVRMCGLQADVEEVWSRQFKL